MQRGAPQSWDTASSSICCNPLLQAGHGVRQHRGLRSSRKRGPERNREQQEKLGRRENCATGWAQGETMVLKGLRIMEMGAPCTLGDVGAFQCRQSGHIGPNNGHTRVSHPGEPYEGLLQMSHACTPPPPPPERLNPCHAAQHAWQLHQPKQQALCLDQVSATVTKCTQQTLHQRQVRKVGLRSHLLLPGQKGKTRKESQPTLSNRLESYSSEDPPRLATSPA